MGPHKIVWPRVPQSHNSALAINAAFACVIVVIGYFNLNVAVVACSCCQVLSLIPENNRKLFEYICEFCRTLLKHSDKNKLNASFLGMLTRFLLVIFMASWGIFEQLFISWRNTLALEVTDEQVQAFTV